MKLLRILGWVVVIVFVLFLVSLFFIHQTKTSSTDLNCEEIRECILLSYSCLDRHIENRYFVWEWEFDDKAFLTTQKDYYYDECMGDSGGTGK